MKKYLRFLLIGILFGIVMTKSEAVSWYRIQEMFRFQSFHMYGIIGMALFFGVISTALIKRFRVKDLDGNLIVFHKKNFSVYRYLLGGIVFGLGWGLSGACPGPMYTLIGNGFFVVFVMLISAVAGTYMYGLLKDKLPH